MLVSAKEMLNRAREGKYAVGQFNINNLEWTKAILLTAEELKSPVILGVSEGAGNLYPCPIAAPICLVLFILAVAITRYVSLGSILVVISFLIQAIVFNHMGLLGVSGNYAVEFDILAACFTAMAIWRHRANIKRLLSGTENKFGQKAK